MEKKLKTNKKYSKEEFERHNFLRAKSEMSDTNHHVINEGFDLAPSFGARVDTELCHLSYKQ